MALIKCEECGKEISDRAKVCVHCGCPISRDEEKNIDNKEFIAKQSTSEFFDKNTGRLSIEFDAVVSNKSKESTINNIYIKELDKHIELLVPNNVKENEKIFKKIEDAKCDIIVFTIKTVSIDPNIKSIPPEKKSKKKSKVNKTIYEIIDDYNPNWLVRFFDGPGVSSVIISFITYVIIWKMWHKEVLIALLIIAIPLILIKMVYPFRDTKKYIKKNHIDDAIKNDPDYLNIAILTYKLMPCRRMLRYIKKLNIEAGLEIERQLNKKK